MKTKTLIKIVIDIAMTISLLLLMTYGLIGEDMHEYIGVAIFILFVLHHILNKHWSKNLLKGKYTSIRILQSILVIAMLLCMLGSMLSGVILSRYVFHFDIKGMTMLARNIHMLCAYWGVVIMSLHLGLHWNIMIAIAKKHIKISSYFFVWIARTVVLIISLYGVYAFIFRRVGRYMLLMDHFVFFNFNESVILFIADYLAIMITFVSIGYYGSKIIKGKK